MPLKRNRFFVGRRADLIALAKGLFEGDSTAVVQAVAATGLGGIGKSQLVSEFVHRYGQYFLGGVYWLSFADASSVPAEVASCGGRGKIELGSDFGVLSFEEQVGLVMSAWQSKLPRLLVFDNCEDEELLDQWLPPTGSCRVLVSSRREQWDPKLVMKTIPLDVLSREESTNLLRKHRPDLSPGDQELDAIARELGDLPLALELAGSYLADPRHRFVFTAGDYLAQLRNPNLLEHPSLKEGGISLTGHEQNVARTFDLSYQRLNTADPTDTLAIALLARAAWFAPGEPIPRDLLKFTLDLPDDDPNAAGRAEDAITRLAELGLVETEAAGALRLHRLLAKFVRDVAAAAVAQAAGTPRLRRLLAWLLAPFVREVAATTEAQAAVEAALLKSVGRLLDEGYPEPLVVLQPHLRAVTDTAREREDEQAALLCTQLGRYLQIVGAYQEARPYTERALSIREKVLGAEYPDTASSLNNLALLLRAQGAYDEAKPLYERALAIWEKVLGAEHPTTKVIRENLATLKD